MNEGISPTTTSYKHWKQKNISQDFTGIAMHLRRCLAWNFVTSNVSTESCSWSQLWIPAATGGLPWRMQQRDLRRRSSWDFCVTWTAEVAALGWIFLNTTHMTHMQTSRTISYSGSMMNYAYGILWPMMFMLGTTRSPRLPVVPLV